MNLEDLKLLVDVAYHERHGQRGFAVSGGFLSASDRLVKSELLVRDPSKRVRVTMTPKGDELVRALLEVGST